MQSVILLFVGLVLIGTGIVVYFAGPVNFADMSRSLAQNVMMIILTLLGALFTFLGIIGIIGAKRLAKRNAFIVQTGIESDATVTFVDRNYTLLVNHRPIYSIVEYTFQDGSGREFMRRIDNVPSDWVIRNKIEVKCTVKIRYLREDPNQSVLIA
jgi:hypothetical protein